MNVKYPSSRLRKILTLPFVLGYTLFSFFQLMALMFFPKKIFYQHYRRLEENEYRHRLREMRPHIQPGEMVLDIGSGSGIFGKKVADALQVKVTGVDVVDYADAQIPLYVYDGGKLPFAEHSFDVVFLAFVMHHCQNHDVIFKEALRVSKNKVILLEDTFETPWQKLFVWWNDYHTNIFQGFIKVIKKYAKSGVIKMPMPLTFRSIEGWKEYFKGFPVRVVAQEVRYMGYKPLLKVTFCLEKVC